MVGYQRLIGGAASETSSAMYGCMNWREEYNTNASSTMNSSSSISNRNSVGGVGGGMGGNTSGGRRGGGGSNLKQLKLKLLDLIAPCRKYALFLGGEEKKTKEAAAAAPSENVVAVEEGNDGGNAVSHGMGISRTVALMVLLTGDLDPDVKSRAESYLRAHMDTYRGRELPRPTTTMRHTTATVEGGDIAEESSAEATSIHDALLGNSVALAQTILTLCLGGATSLNIEKSLSCQYGDAISTEILKSRLGLTYYGDVSNAQEQKLLLSCSRMKMAEQSATTALKFVAKMLDENPRLFQVGMDMEMEESDVAAVSIGTLVLAIMKDMHRPGSSASLALESAASLLNSLCVRLSLFYDARVQSRTAVPHSLDRLRLLLARAMETVCSILAPTSSGESTSLTSVMGTKVSTTQIDIRDRCYGVICTLSRSLFALDDRYALFDCGNFNPRYANTESSFSISTAELLFGCTSNEVDMLQPRATSALDALLGAKNRAVKFIADQKKSTPVVHLQEELDAAANPWANIMSEPADNKMESKVVDSSSGGLARSLLPLLWNAARSSQPKSSRLAAARWSSDLLLGLDSTNAFHILCFLTGDADATVAAIAKHALRVDKSLGEDYIISSVSNSSEVDGSEGGNTRPAFSALVDAIIGCQSSTTTRPMYSTFNVRAKAATIRFLLQSLFSEENLYENSDCLALQKYVSTILGTIFYKDRSLSRDEIDLIDECSIALASCTATSREARLTVTERGVPASESQYSYINIAKLALTSNSSKSRVS